MMKSQITVVYLNSKEVSTVVLSLVSMLDP